MGYELLGLFDAKGAKRRSHPLGLSPRSELLEMHRYTQVLKLSLHPMAPCPIEWTLVVVAEREVDNEW